MRLTDSIFLFISCKQNVKTVNLLSTFMLFIFANYFVNFSSINCIVCYFCNCLFLQSLNWSNFKPLKILTLCQAHKSRQNMKFHQVYRIAKFQKIEITEGTPPSQKSLHSKFYQTLAYNRLAKLKKIVGNVDFTKIT